MDSSDNKRQEKLEAFGKLLDVMDTLRRECPWDRKQTAESLRINTIEEVHELSDAIVNNSDIDIKKELGDILLHVVFYSKIFDEQKSFDIADVCNSLCDKLIYRHPHIYGDANVKDADEVIKNWEQIKRKEKDGNKTVLSGVPSSLSSIIKAQRLQDKARGVGFDWQNKEDVWDKVEEEIYEWKHSLISGCHDSVEDEFGDIMFSLVNVARLYGINPDNALERTNRKFISRFNFIEKKSKEIGIDIKDMSLEQMDKYWQEAKHSLR